MTLLHRASDWYLALCGIGLFGWAGSWLGTRDKRNRAARRAMREAIAAVIRESDCYRTHAHRRAA